MALIAGLLGTTAPVYGVTIDFESLSDLEAVGTQFTGLTFTSTTVLSAGISLNEFEFPPFSGSNVVFDDGGTITIAFDAPQASVGGYFTYLTPITLTAFGASGDVLGSITSTFGSNLALSGDSGSSANEFLQLAFSGGVTRIMIEGDPAGGSFTLDDLTYEPARPAAAVPEPSSLVLIGLGLLGAMAWRRGRPRSWSPSS